MVVSDGGDNASKGKLAEILKLAGQASTLIYTIGVFEADDPDSNTGVLRNLAHSTGGEAYFPGETSDVVAICERIAADIRHQYTLGYVSNAKNSGGYRSIRVAARTAANDKLTVRVRTGYIAGAR